jgi:UDP-2-acetamido-2-deoxy-ribo-hexuluronate aminotransferase
LIVELLLDVNVVVDLCAPRVPWYGQAKAAVTQCRERGELVWLYAGSVQTLQYNLQNELKRLRPELSGRRCMTLAQSRLAHFARDKQWLAALAGEGDVFASEDPEDEQLLRALARLGPDARLLSRDEPLAERYPERVLSPAAYLAMDRPSRTLEFMDLKARQASIRPALEENLHRVLHHGQYIQGPEIAELEAALAEYVGVRHGLTVARWDSPPPSPAVGNERAVRHAAGGGAAGQAAALCRRG